MNIGVSCIRALFALLASGLILGCGGGGSNNGSGVGTGPVPTAGTLITQPTTINLYPNQSSVNAPRFTVFVTSVGNVAVNMPLGFDTGSPGVTLYAPSIFPSSMVNSSGFVFPAGQTSISYNGITVTNVQGARTYGTTSRVQELGNLGFAQLSFGDGQGKITTKTMPVFLFYAMSDGSTVSSTSAWQGWFGVSGTSEELSVAGAVAPTGGFGECTLQSTTSCQMTSALKYLNYGNGINGGFIVSPASIPTCDITTPGSCAPAPMLTVGVNANVEAGFSSAPLTCPPNGYVGPSTLAGYPVCQKFVPGMSISVSGNLSGQFNGYTSFDTGEPYVYLSVPPGSSIGSIGQTDVIGTNVNFTTPSGFHYSYTSTDTYPAYTIVNSNGDGGSILGILYFTTNSLLLDFTSSIEGWK